MAEERINGFLAGRVFVIVGPETSAYNLVTELRLRGAEVMTVPRLEIIALENFERLDEAIDHLYGYDWLLFTTISGVEYFLQRLQQKSLDTGALDELRVCAVGEDVERLLREERIHVDVVPSSSGADEVFASLERFLGGSGALAGLNLLSPRATSVPDSLARVLSDAGARVDLVPTYRVVSPEADPARTAALVSGAADCLVLTSAESPSQLARLFDAHDLSEMLAQVSILSLDQETARTAAGYGLRVKALTAQYPIAQVLQTIKDSLAG